MPALPILQQLHHDQISGSASCSKCCRAASVSNSWAGDQPVQTREVEARQDSTGPLASGVAVDVLQHCKQTFPEPHLPRVGAWPDPGLTAKKALFFRISWRLGGWPDSRLRRLPRMWEPPRKWRPRYPLPPFHSPLCFQRMRP